MTRLRLLLPRGPQKLKQLPRQWVSDGEVGAGNQERVPRR
jgi:hypothetical protein